MIPIEARLETVATCRKRTIIATRPRLRPPGPKTRAGVATCRKRTIIATRPRLRPRPEDQGRRCNLPEANDHCDSAPPTTPARRPGRALQLAGSERSLRLGPAYDPRPEDQGRRCNLPEANESLRLEGQLKPVTPCRKCMIATCGGAGASYTRMYYVCLRIGQRYSHCERTPSQERWASARRGQRIVMPKEVRVLAAIEHRQERRSSARRGLRNAITLELRLSLGLHAVKSGGREPAVVSGS
jgi:hypothetical protein